MVLKKIILCMVKPACKQGFIFTKEVHSYIYAYVFIQIIDADYDTISNFCKIVAGLIIMLFMIFTSGYLFIYNTLYISVSKDIRYYGQLKTIGMTSVQLKRMVYQQAIWNAVIGIPLGLIAAVVAAKIVIPQLLHIINPILSASDVVSVNVWVFLIAGCFALLTNLISCKKPAKIAVECSPIEAVRYTIGTGKVKNRKRESGGIYSMALQNMFRDKKQAVIIFMSFIIALSIFFVINVIIRENDARSILNETYSYDIRFKNETMLDNDRKQLITDDMISQIENINGVKSVRKVTSTEAVIPYQEDVYGAYYEELYQSRYSPGNYEDDMKLYQQEKVLGNGIGFIIAMLAVLNYLNMMAASVQNRSKEFATLESIGMTTKQIKKMLRMEGVGYTIISIAISLIVGIPVSYVVFNGMNLYRISFSIPWINSQVWKEPYYRAEDNVAGVIHRIRKKVEPDPSNPIYVLTVWGIGCRFSPYMSRKL